MSNFTAKHEKYAIYLQELSIQPSVRPYDEERPHSQWCRISCRFDGDVKSGLGKFVKIDKKLKDDKNVEAVKTKWQVEEINF